MNADQVSEVAAAAVELFREYVDRHGKTPDEAAALVPPEILEGWRAKYDPPTGFPPVLPKRYKNPRPRFFIDAVNGRDVLVVERSPAGTDSMAFYTAPSRTALDKILSDFMVARFNAGGRITFAEFARQLGVTPAPPAV